MRPLKAYLAGPEVFLPDAVEIGRRKVALCASRGLLGLFPLDEETGATGAAEPRDRAIYEACLTLMRDADLAIANLTPFRGTGADPGTVFELGFMTALGKPVFGYTNVAADLIERVRGGGALTRDGSTGAWRDDLGMAVEDFGHADNLMIAAGLARAGRPIVRHHAEPDARFRDLAGFELCLDLAVAALRPG